MRLYKFDAGEDIGGILIDLSSIVAITEAHEISRDENAVWIGFDVSAGMYGFPCVWSMPIAAAKKTLEEITEIHDDLVTAWKQHLDTTYEQI